MLLTFEEVSKKIKNGILLHIAGTETLLKKLPKGNWIGGSTEYFMAKDGGVVSGDMLFVTEPPCENFSIKNYSVKDIKNVANDAYDNGFSIAILPFDSGIHKEYAENADGFENMFIRTIVGWIAGINLNEANQTPISINGVTGEAYTNQAVVAHLEVDSNKTVAVDIINIFKKDESSPVIEFPEDGFVIKNCIVDGKTMPFVDYLTKNNINTKMPIVGDYSGRGVNVSFKSIQDGVVYMYAPVFAGIQYRHAKEITSYEDAFRQRLKDVDDSNTVFSCNCILNFLYGELEGKKMDAFSGPITFGEIAYKLVNQTLVYVTVS